MLMVMPFLLNEGMEVIQKAENANRKRGGCTNLEDSPFLLIKLTVSQMFV